MSDGARTDIANMDPFTWSRAAAAHSYQAPEAFLCVLFIAATIDRNMATLESDRLHQITRRWVERGVVGERDVEALNFAVCARLEKAGETALADACAVVPAPARASLFAQALDLLLVDGPLQVREEAFAQELSRALEVDDAEARCVRECLTVKNAY